MYYINTLKRELVDTNAYKLQPSLSERVIVDGHGCHTALNLGVKAKENQDKVLVYKLKKIVGSKDFSVQFIKTISHYKKIRYNINVLQQTACLVVNPNTVGNFAFLFNCTPVGWTSDSMTVPT